MKKINLTLLILLTILPHLFATDPSVVKLYSPENNAIQQDTVYFAIQWLQATDVSGEKVTYDLYLGTNPNPVLFKNDLDPSINGYYNGTTNEIIMETALTIDGAIYAGVYYVNYYADTLRYNTTYYWKVIAKNESGETSESETFSFTTYNQPPSAPVLLSPVNMATEVSATPKFIWNKSNDIDGDMVTYTIQLKEEGGNFATLGSGIVDTTYTLNTKLTDYTTYHWQVIAIDAVTAKKTYSTTSSFTVENYKNDTPVLDALLSPSNGAKNLGFDSITLKWSASDIDDEPLKYDVYADQNSNPGTLIAEDISADTLFYSFDKYDTYYWKVVVKDTSGLADTSEVYSFSCWEQAPDFSMEMVDVTDNDFQMGITDAIYYWTDYFCDGRTVTMEITNEYPQHNVILDDYQIGKYEVTNEQYCKFLNSLVTNTTVNIVNHTKSHRIKSFPYRAVQYNGDLLCQVFDSTRSLNDRDNVAYEAIYDSPIIWNGTNFKVDANFTDHPVRFMYYEGARLFADWAGNYRLPTEAEWENAAKGGNQSKGYKYSGSNDYDEVAVHAENSCTSSVEPSTQAVGSLKPNELGIYDMSGNVEEICSDYYDANYYSKSPTENPENTSYTTLGHVLRNSGFNSYDSVYFRITKRAYTAYAQYINYAGFRLAKTIQYYTVTFNDWDGTTLKIDTVRCDSAATAPIDPSRIGYTFIGWDTGFSQVTGNLIVTAEYTQNGVNNYTVIFKDWDGKILKTETVEYGKSATPPDEPARTGYTFAGWDSEFNQVSGNLVVTAQYSVNTYTVTFKDWDEKILKTETVEYGKGATPPDEPARTGYTFTGWDSDFNRVTGNLVVTAQYSVNTYTVTFKDWDEKILKTETVEYGKGATPPDEPARTGLTFTGWDSDFSQVTGNLIVTAQYTVASGVENINISGIKIYPNPVENNLVIEIEKINLIENTEKGISIFNCMGQKLYHIKNIETKQEIDISNYPQGIYFVSIGDEIKRIIKE